MPPKRKGKQLTQKDGSKQRGILSFFGTGASSVAEKSNLGQPSKPCPNHETSRLRHSPLDNPSSPDCTNTASGRGPSFKKASYLVGSVEGLRRETLSAFPSKYPPNDNLGLSFVKASSLVHGSSGHASTGLSVPVKSLKVGSPRPFHKDGRTFQSPRNSTQSDHGTIGAYSSQYLEGEDGGSAEEPCPPSVTFSDWKNDGPGGREAKGAGVERGHDIIPLRMNVVGLQFRDEVVKPPTSPAATSTITRGIRAGIRELFLEREPCNPHDGNAIKVLLAPLHFCPPRVAGKRSGSVPSGDFIGYIPGKMTMLLAPLMDASAASVSIEVDMLAVEAEVDLKQTTPTNSTMDATDILAMATATGRRTIPVVVSVTPLGKVMLGHTPHIDCIICK
ncbi:unnamed protein product, partial [Choristocarpus tenellus]